MTSGEQPQVSAPAAPSLGRATRTMAVATTVSRLTGFARTVVLVAAIGLGLVGDAYNTANTLPNIVYELLLGGVLTSVIVPLLVHARVRDADDGLAYTQRLLSLLTVVLLAATTLAILAAPLLTYAYGIRDDPDQVALANVLARILLVEIVFYGVGAMLTAILNSRQVFGPPAWAPVLNNLVVIATGFVFIGLNDAAELTTATISPGLVWLLGVGTTLGIVVQAVALLPSLRRAGVRWAWRWDWRHAGLGEAGRLGLWVVGYVAVSQAGYLVIMALANAAGRASGIGSIVYANASLLFQLPYGIIGVALLTALLPRMSAAAAGSDTAAVVRDLSLGARLTAVALIPVSAILIVLGPAIATVAFARGQVDLTQARTVGVVLAVSAFGLFPYAVTMLQLRVFYAMKDARTPTLINLAMVAVRIPLCLLVPVVLPSHQVVAGLAVANSLSFVLGAVVGELWLRRRVGRLDTARVLRTAGLLLLASTVGALAAWGAASAAESLLGQAVLGSVVAVLAGSLVGGVVLLVGCLILPIPEVRELAVVLRRRFGGAEGSRQPEPPDPTGGGPPAVGEFEESRRGKASQVKPGGPERPAGPPEEPTPGQPVTIGGRYDLLGRSGADVDTGAGRLSTWRARDTLLRRDVLLRIHAPGGRAAGDFIDRALAAGVLSHPALAMVYDAVDESRRAYVVSEWVEGTSLAERLQSGPMGEADARETIRRVAEGVAQAHELGLAVGGLVPERVILTAAGSVAVVAIPAATASRDTDVRALGGLLFATMTGYVPVEDDPAELQRQLAGAVSADLAEVALAALDGQLGSVGEIVSRLLAGRQHRSEDGGLAFITDHYEYESTTTQSRSWPSRGRLAEPRRGVLGRGPAARAGSRTGQPSAGDPGSSRSGGPSGRQPGSAGTADGQQGSVQQGSGQQKGDPAGTDQLDISDYPTDRTRAVTVDDTVGGTDEDTVSGTDEDTVSGTDEDTAGGTDGGATGTAGRGSGGGFDGSGGGSDSAAAEPSTSAGAALATGVRQSGKWLAARVTGLRRPSEHPDESSGDPPSDAAAEPAAAAGGAFSGSELDVGSGEDAAAADSPAADSSRASTEPAGRDTAPVDMSRRLRPNSPASDPDPTNTIQILGAAGTVGVSAPVYPPGLGRRDSTGPIRGGQAGPSGDPASGGTSRDHTAGDQTDSDAYRDPAEDYPDRDVEQDRGRDGDLAVLVAPAAGEPPQWLEKDTEGPERRRRTWLVLAFPIAALLAVAIIGWVIGSAIDNVAQSPTGSAASETSASTGAVSSTAQSPTPTVPAAGPLTVDSATVYDPFGDGEPENNDDSPLAFDNDPGTSWSTLNYRGSPLLGNLKPGVGLVFDLGSDVMVSEVTITTEQPGASVELRAGQAPTGDLDSFRLVGQAQLAADTSIPVDSAQPARYWLVWITELVPDGEEFSASLGEVSFTGVPAA